MNTIDKYTIDVMKKCIVFSDCDLDGIGSYLVFRWFTGMKNLEHEICSQSNFRKTFSAWSMKNKIEDYDKVYIFDLDVSQDNLDLVDHKNVSIIDHHDTHVQNKDKYKKATTILTEYTSCCKLLYDLLRKKYINKTLTDHQKLLILMVDDYDSYKLQIKGSYELNIILWNYVGQRAEQFTRDFGNGFMGFNQYQLNMIALNKKKVTRILSELQIFKGKLPLNGKNYNLYATMASESLNEVAHHIIEKHDCDIILVMNMNTKRVSFRMNKDTCPEVDLGKLASSIAEGGGHPYSAGGKLTEKVMTLTKLLTRVST
jgi:nanoRNase/pAp phosphatase (c-di-AMP/oligoRNAs hydrolase)